MNMRVKHLRTLACTALIALGACDDAADREAAENMGALNVLDEAGISDIVLNFADPNEAARYFQNSLIAQPDRVDFMRGYALSLMRAKRPVEAILAYERLEASGGMTDADRFSYAEALIQSNQWELAEAQLGKIPPTLETYDRYRLEAMLADYRKQWDRADAFYQSARSRTTRPGPIYNNWGISMLSRGNLSGAEEKFREAVRYDPSLFSAKNNMAIARAQSGNYALPVVPLTAVERAQILHNMALQAIRNGDIDIGRGLLEEAIAAHPQYFEAAVNKLAALEATVAR